MHQLAAYLKEREGFDCIVTDEGFASYRISGEECYIRDIWVHPDHRNKRIATDMADDISRIALRYHCKFLTGSVDTTRGNPTASVEVLLAYGFKIFSAIQGGIYFRKNLPSGGGLLALGKACNE